MSTNSNQILSSGNLTLSATNLTNSNTIQSNSALVLNLTSLTNSKNIISGTTFDIAASVNVTNSATLQSADSFTINAASLTNSASSLVLAGKDLTIKATSITNQNTKPSTSTITSGIVSANGAVNLETNTLNNNSGIIAGKSTSLTALSTSSVNLSNTLGAFISTAAILLNLGNLDYAITGTITASNIDITANNIINQGNVTANEYIKLNATGVSGNGYIINGISNGNNSDIKLAAGSYLTMVANDFINNYATISSQTDLTLTSKNNTNNYSTGKITGGNGTTTITTNNVNGSFNNFVSLNSSAVLTSNGNLVLNLKELNNYGEISVANNITTNITGNFNNYSNALIWSGNDATFNVDNIFTNDYAQINAGKNLVIQNRSSGKNNKIQNLNGGGIESIGNLIILTKELLNQKNGAALTVFDREEFEFIHKDTNDTATPSDDIIHYSHNQGGPFFQHLGYHARLNLNRGRLNDGYQITIGGLTWSDHRAGIDRTVFYQKENPSLLRSNLISGGNMYIYADKTTNDLSNITSSGNMLIEGITLDNKSSQIVSTVKYHCHDGSEFCSGVSFDRSGNFYFQKVTGDIFSFIKSGGSLTGSFKSRINNSTIAQTTTVSPPDFDKHSTTFNKIDIYTLGETGAISVDLSSIISAINNNSSSERGSSLALPVAALDSISLNSVANLSIDKTPSNSSTDISSSSSSISSSSLTASTPNTIFSGSFKINLDKAATTPLVEARSQFADVSKFFGSKYYFDALGLNGSAVLADINRQTRDLNPTRMLGDAFVETKLISDQLKTLTNDSLFLSKTTTDQNQQIKELIDNSISELTRLGLNAQDVAIKGLTTDQTNSLTKDIVTFEATKLNGISVLAPKIYLSLATRNRLLGSDSALASNSTIFAKDNLTIDAPTADLFNSGSIVAGNNLTLNVGSLISSSAINSSANLGSASISAIAKIKAGNDLTITANNQISSNSLAIVPSNLAISSLSSLKSSVSALSPSIFSSSSSIPNSPRINSGINLQNTLISAGNKTSFTSASDISIANDKNLTLTSLSSAIPALESATLSSANTTGEVLALATSNLLASSSTSSIKDDAAAARLALTFNSASDIEITSAGSINIANNYTNTGGSIFMTAANNINNSNFTIYASDNVVMDANNINNISSATSANKDTISETKIEAGNIVSLNATKDAEGNGGNITNIGATIKAGELAYLTADNNITNKALVEYNINGKLSYSSGLTDTQTAADFSNTTLDSAGTSASDTNLQSSNSNYTLLANYFFHSTLTIF